MSRITTPDNRRPPFERRLTRQQRRAWLGYMRVQLRLNYEMNRQPVAVYAFALFALYTYLVHSDDPFHIKLLAGTAAVLALAVLLAYAGLPMAICLVVLMVAPLVTVLGYETVGPRHLDAALNGALAA